jgi:hypothetical protein
MRRRPAIQLDQLVGIAATQPARTGKLVETLPFGSMRRDEGIEVHARESGTLGG